MNQLIEAQYVWHDDAGRGRNLHACFRLTFILDAAVVSARLNLFADTTYQLFVNGQFVEFGPIRFDPRFPMFDTVDIAHWLRVGRNVIAVSVNSFQHKTLKSITHQAGFITWGEVRTSDDATVSLATPGAWRGVPDLSLARYTGKFSFALNAAELFDQAGEEPGWREADFADGHWPQAVSLANQAAWGPLEPRSIPFLSKASIPFERVTQALPLAIDEDWYSFAVPFPAFYEADKKTFSSLVAFATWIHSPEDQEIIAGVFWGEYWLNGKRIPDGVLCTFRNQRINQSWRLRKGWNYFFGTVQAYQNIVEQYFALPRGKGLFVSADKDLTGTRRFKHTRILMAAEHAEHLTSKPVPFVPDDALEEIGGWIYVDVSECAQSPSRELGWDSYSEPVETLTPETLQGHIFRHTDYPEGFSLVLDAGQTRLVLPRLVLDGVEGATIDLGYTEHLRGDGVHIQTQHHSPCSDRILCSRDNLDWMPRHPRGFRYLMLTVRNTRADVTLRKLSLRSAMYPVQERGRFTCSDPLLTAIWEMGRRTQAVTMEDAYVDCVGRERGMYGRDTIIQYHVNLATFGDQTLMERCLQLFGQSPDASGKFRAVYPNTGDYTIADFALNMVDGYWNYYAHSGDLERIRQDWAAILVNLHWFHELSDERKDYLLDADWPANRRIAAEYGGYHGDSGATGYMSKKGPTCLFSCFYLSALQAASRLAKALGGEALTEKRRLDRRSARLAASIQVAFWDEGRGCFADDLAHTTVSAHASLLAVCTGVAKRRQVPRIRQHVSFELRSIFRNGFDPSGGTLTSPSFAFYLFDGLYHLGLHETAESMMRQGWGWMLAQGLKTCVEHFSLADSLCHAWSASPTYYLSKNVLGVHFPEAPNLDVVEIRIRTHGVTWAEGAFPHPRGAIEVKWRREGGRCIIETKVPEGVCVTKQGES